MVKGKVQFVSEAYQVMIDAIVEIAEVDSQSVVERATTNMFKELLVMEENTLTDIVLTFISRPALVTELAYIFCVEFNVKLGIASGKNGLQSPTFFYFPGIMEVIPLTAEQVGELIARLGSVGWEMTGKELNRYTYERVVKEDA
jgi:hypothetical protein